MLNKDINILGMERRQTKQTIHSTENWKDKQYIAPGEWAEWIIRKM